MLVLYYSSPLRARRKGHSPPGSSREVFWPIVCKCLCRERRQPDGARDVALRGAGGSPSVRPGGRLATRVYATSHPTSQPGAAGSPPPPFPPPPPCPLPLPPPTLPHHSAPPR